MRPKSIVILAVFVAMTLSVSLAGTKRVTAPNNKKTIEVDETMVVGTTTLKPGAYTIQWNGAGPDVEVSFSQDRKTITTVPATLAPVQSPYDLAFVKAPRESGTPSLVEIEMKTSTLRFTPDASSGQ